MPLNRHHAFALGPVLQVKKASPALSWKERLIRKIATRLRTALAAIDGEEALQSFRNGAVMGKGCNIGPSAWCANCGKKEDITIGSQVICRGVLRIESWQPGTLVIGDDVYLGDDTLVSCANRVEIGKLTMIAHGVQIFDNDSHPLDPTLREQDYLTLLGRHPMPRPPIANAPVVIGDHVWIGMNSLVMKGVTIGAGSVVAAGSVVTSDIPPRSVAAGVPARVIAAL